MKPAPFEYHAPETLADAATLVAEHRDECKALAGGQSLVPMLALRLTRFEHLVDLNRVDELAGITREDGTLTIGAMTRQRAVELDPTVAAAVPLLALAAPHIGHFQIRNRGTVGGSLAHADPASELPAVALALDAELELASASATRRVPAGEFFVGTWTTCLADDELLVRARFPVWEGRTGFAFEEVARRLGDFALAGVACGIALADDGTVARAAIALLGMGSTPVRAHDGETALVGRAPTPSDVAEIGQIAVRDLEPAADIHASARYRKHIGAYLVERTITRALTEATEAAR